MDWQDIKTCPKDVWHKPFLVFDANGDKRKIKIALWHSSDSGGCVYDVYGGYIRHATHWMPLPEYPDPLPDKPYGKRRGEYKWAR